MPDLPAPGRTSLGIYQLRPGKPVWPDFPAQGDVLSDPAVDDLARVFYGLLPSGAAWRSPDGAAFEEGTWLGKFWRALAGDFVTLYRRLFRLSTSVVALDAEMREIQLKDAKATLSAVVTGLSGANPRSSRGTAARRFFPHVPSFGQLLAAFPGDEADITPRGKKPGRPVDLRCSCSTPT